MAPAVLRLDDFTCSILGQLTHQLTVCRRHCSDIQITGLYIGYTDIGISPGSPLCILGDLKVFFHGTFRLQDGCDAAGSHQNTAFCRQCRHRRCQYTKCHSHCNYSYLSVFLIFYHKNLSVKFLLRICYKFITSRY